MAKKNALSCWPLESEASRANKRRKNTIAASIVALPKNTPDSKYSPTVKR